MLKFMLKRQGAISIFLTIILLPMLSIGCVMVDMSRIRLARSMAESAGDLTLNTGLTYYDNVLKDMYGLMAASQDYDSFISNLKDYYTKTISSAGISDKQTENYVDKIMNQLTGLGVSGDSDTSDLMQMKVIDFKAIQREEASLVNPALLKSQIVNFMKYRGPIQFGLGFLDSLKSFSTIGDQLKVVEAKQDYYKERQTVVEKCEEAYRNMYDYNLQNLTQKAFTDGYDTLNGYKIRYQFVNQNIVYDYYGAKGNFDDEKHTYAIDNGGTFTFYNKGKLVSESQYTVTGANELSSYISNMNQAKANFKEVLGNDISKQMCLGETSGVYDIKRIIYYQKYSDDAKGYANAAYKLYMAYNKFITAKSSLEKDISSKEDDLQDLQDTLESMLTPPKNLKKGEVWTPPDTSGIEESISSLSKQIEKEQEWLNKQYNGKTASKWESEFTDYYQDPSTMKAFSNLTHPMKKIITGSSKLSYEMQEKTFLNKKDLVDGGFSNGVLKDISDYIDDLYTRIVTGIDDLENAKSNLEFVSNEVAPDGELTGREKTWDDNARKDTIVGTSVSEQNIEEVKSVHEFINKADVDDLLKHIDGAIVTLKNAKKELDSYQYGDSTLKDVTNLDKAVDAIDKKGYGTQIENVRAMTSELDALSRTVFSGMYKEPSKGLTHSWSEDTSHPELEHIDHKFYKYLKGLYYKVVQEGEKYTNRKKDAEKTQSDAEDKLKSYDTLKDDSGSDESSIFKFAGSLPSNEWVDKDGKGGLKAKAIKHNEEAMAEYEKAEGAGGNISNTMEFDAGVTSGGALTNMFASLGKELANMGITLRDDLFLSGYIMNMFSYDTFENEKIWEANGKKTDLSQNTVPQNTITVNDKSYKTACYNADGTFSCSAAGKLKAADLMSLTKVPISPQNNAAYRSEVEYIIYGSDNGKTKAYGTIYAIRAGFNIIYAFSDTTIRSTAQGIATAIFGTPPLTFMVPIAQAAIIIGVALAESALDISCLKAGMAVPIYKTKETWMLSIDNLLKNTVGVIKSSAGNAAKGIVNEAINTTTDQLNEWLDMTDEQLKEYVNGTADSAQDKINELGDAVKDSMTKGVEQYIGTAVDQMITLCENTKTLIAGGKLEKSDRVEYVKSKLNSWAIADNVDTTSIVYEAKIQAVDLLISEGYVEKVLEQLDTLEQTAANKITDLQDKTIVRFSDYIDQIVNYINDQIIGNTEGKINKYITEAGEKAKQKLAEGSDELKKSINSYIDQLSGGGGTGGTDANTNVTASLYSFQYSDYLQLFLMIALLINQESVLLRTADMIQTNTGLAEKGKVQLTALNDKSTGVFRLKNAFTYLEVESTIEVKPIFMKLPFMPDEADNLINNNKNWYTIQYRGVQGY